MLIPIKSAIHLHTAAVDGKYVVAYQDGEPIGDGYIEEIGESSVKLSGERYEWDACEFFVLEDAEQRTLFRTESPPVGLRVIEKFVIKEYEDD